MNENILILKKNNEDVFFKGLNNVERFYSCKNDNLLLRIWLKFKLPFLYFFFGSWKKNINKYNIVIVFDNGFTKQISKFIKSKKKNIKIIFWYWNSIIEYNNKVIEDENIDEIWTYNRFDSMKNHLKYNTQFYRKIFEPPKNTEEYDVIFMGRNKGRESCINNIYKELSNKRLKCKFKIINNEKDYVSYEEYINELSKSKCILDFSLEYFTVMSLRPL